MTDLHERYQRIMLQRDFSRLHDVMPNSYEVLTILGDDAFNEYIKARDILKKLWRSCGEES